MWFVREGKWSNENNEKEGEGGFIENDVSEKWKQRIDTKYKTLINLNQIQTSKTIRNNVQKYETWYKTQSMIQWKGGCGWDPAAKLDTEWSLLKE